MARRPDRVRLRHLRSHSRDVRPSSRARDGPCRSRLTRLCDPGRRGGHGAVPDAGASGTGAAWRGRYRLGGLSLDASLRGGAVLPNGLHAPAADHLVPFGRAHASLVDGGIVVAVEPWSTNRLEDGIGNPVVRMDYAISTSVCTPCALAQPGGHGMGNQGGPGKRLALLAEAGFRDPIVAADTGLNLVLAATK